MRNTYLVRIALCAALMLVATSAWAKEGWYAGGSGGVSFGADADFSTRDIGTVVRDSRIGPAFLGNAGYAVGDGVRLEGEISWRRNLLEADGLFLDLPEDGNSLFEADVQNLALMVNGAYDFQVDWPVTPFVMGGVGVSLVTSTFDVDGSETDEEATELAYQVGTGLTYHVTESVAFDAQYRFFGTPSAKFDTLGVTVNNTHHNVLFGLKYSF